MRKREERERERERERKRERERESNFADVEPVLMFILFHCLRLAMLQSSLLLHGLVHSGCAWFPLCSQHSAGHWAHCGYDLRNCLLSTSWDIIDSCCTPFAVHALRGKLALEDATPRHINRTCFETACLQMRDGRGASPTQPFVSSSCLT